MFFKLQKPTLLNSHMVISTENLVTQVKDFIKWAKPQLGIDIPLKVKLVPVKKTINGQFSFGSFNPNNNEIIVAYKDRHILDILRSLSHEMVHLHQNLLGELNADSGKDGSPQENQCNSFAGILMRRWNKQE